MQKIGKQYFTRKNFIAISLVSIFSILLIFVSLCIDRSDWTAFISKKNMFALMADAFGFTRVEAGVYGFVCVALVAVYAVIFTCAFIYERRLAFVSGKGVWSRKMAGVYAATLGVCLLLSLGLGLLIQPQITGENVVRHLTYLGESLLITVLLYAVLFALIGSVVMLVVNFRKIGKPFDFLTDKALDEVMDDEEVVVPLSDSFDPAPANVTAQGAAVSAGASVAEAAAVAPAARELEDREKVFPALSAIDEKYEGYTVERIESDEVTLKELCEGFRDYLACVEKLYYDIDTIRVFVSGLNTSRLILLEGLSGTGKSSLPRYFAKYVGGRAVFVPVQATWRDRTNLLGYFNDFSKTYSETDFLTALYEANYDEDRISLFVLDELNISRVEYYFADFLSVLEYPAEDWKLRIMHLPAGFLPPVKLEEGCVKIPENAYFIGTANKDDSTFSIADKVYDRAITIDFVERNQPFVPAGDGATITLGRKALQSLFDAAVADPANAMTREDYEKFNKVADFVYDEFDVAFGNRILNQISLLVPTFLACGGTKESVLDFILARKILVKLEGRFEDYIKPKLRQLASLLASLYGANVFVRSEATINRLMRKL